MSKKALLFIPDISGFTKFVNETDVDHSVHIISELLEVILDKNVLNLTLAEIEGDALFMYNKEADVIFDELLNQAKSMYIAFHEHLLQYSHRRICQCGACSTASGLNLKFIVHVAPIDFIEVAGISKPFGTEIVKVHRLLKNDVTSNEYLLLSQETIDSVGEFNLPKDTVEYETNYDFGLIKYSAIEISHFRKEISPIPSFSVIKSKVELFSTKIEISAPLADVYEITSNLAYRTLWNKSIKSITYDKDKLNRVGTKHLCVIGGNTLELETLNTNKNKRPLVFAERTKEIPFTSQLDNFYVFTELENSVQVKTTVYVTFKKRRSWLKFILTIMIKRDTVKAMKGLKKLSEEIGLSKLILQNMV